MNIVEFLEIMSQSIPQMEAELGRPMSAQEKVQVVKGALAKWNLANPDNWLTLPADFND